MASLRKRTYRAADGTRKRSGKWSIRYKDADGLLREVPGFKDKEATAQLAAKLEREAELGRAGVRDPFAEHRSRPIREHVDDFERTIQAMGFSAKYVENTARWVRAVIRGIKATRFDDFAPSAVQQYLGELHRQGRAPATVNNYLSAVQSFLNWAVKDRRLASNPIATLSKRNTAVDLRRRRRSLTADQLFQLVEVADQSGPIDGVDGFARGTAYVLAGYLGLRRGEIGGLRLSDIDLDERTITVRAAVSKNRKQASLPLHPVVVERLTKFLAGRRIDARRPILPIAGKETALMMRRDLEAAGIEFETDSGRVDFHALRVSFASNLGRSGVPIQTARELMRHSTVELTARVYTKLELRDLSGAMERLPSSPSKPGNVSAKGTGTDGLRRGADPMKPVESLPTLLPIAGDFSRLRASNGDNPMSLRLSTQAERSSGFGDSRRYVTRGGQKVGQAPRACRNSIFVLSSVERW